MIIDKKIVGNRIKLLRQENKLTQENLALLLGLNNKSSISQYENGSIIPSDKIKLKLCDIFNCSIEYLMGISNDRNEIDYNEWEKQSKENDKNYSSKTKSKTNNEDKNNQDFRFAYKKETEGMTDEEIKDALRFYKEMKKKIKGENK